MDTTKPEANSGPNNDVSVNTEPPVPTPDAPKPQRKRPQKPNYALIHSKPLPLQIHPLPAFIPHSPLSLLRIASVLLQQFFSPPSSHSETPYIGYFSSETRSVHVTDPVHIRALWEMGFFGKGTLSRSEPSWLEREKARLKAGGGGGTSEEATRKRREDRRLFKLERARLEREQIEEQLRQEKAASVTSKDESEASTLDGQDAKLSHVFPWLQDTVSIEPIDVSSKDESTVTVTEKQPEAKEASPLPQPKKVQFSIPPTQTSAEASNEEEIPLQNQEHLQLTLEEAFFLSYALGSLQIHTTPKTPTPLNNADLFTLSRQHSTFPPETGTSNLEPDDPFLLNYVVYHHYRSLGWVIRPGVKFSVDYLLYNRGPVFSHAEFAILIIPEYSPASEIKKKSKDWWWLHCINRVQSQVKKSLVLCYVQVPDALPAWKHDEEKDIGALLKGFKVREFVVRRWLANRSRD